MKHFPEYNLFVEKNAWKDQPPGARRHCITDTARDIEELEMRRWLQNLFQNVVGKDSVLPYLRNTAKAVTTMLQRLYSRVCFECPRPTAENTNGA